MEEEVACTEMETSSLRSTEAKIDLKSRSSVAEYTSVINGKKGILTLGWENTLREGGSELRWVSHPLATISSLDYALLSTPKQIQVLRTGVANICEKKPEESLRELACGRLG